MNSSRRLDLATGTFVVIGDDLVRGLTTPQEPPTQAALDQIVGPATRVVVSRVFGPRWPRIKTTSPRGLDSLRAALRVRDGGVGHCMCLGTLVFDFSKGDESLGEVTLHHGESLRWEPFFANAELVDPKPLLNWLAIRGMLGQRLSFEAARLVGERDSREERRWRAAMPHALQPLWESMQEPRLEWPEAAAALEREFPDPVERARVLMEWLGKNSRPKDGVPVYEEVVPDWCLRQLPLGVLLDAVERDPRPAALLDGAIWFFSGWYFRHERGSDFSALPRSLKGDLVSHARRAGDRPTRRRAKEFLADA